MGSGSALIERDRSTVSRSPVIAPELMARAEMTSHKLTFHWKSNYAVFSEQCPGGLLTDLLDLSSKESSKSPVAFQKELCHFSCWKPKG